MLVYSIHLKPVLVETIRRIKRAKLREIVSACAVVFPDVEPCQVHDALNTLLQEGFISLDASGVYFWPK